MVMMMDEEDEIFIKKCIIVVGSIISMIVALWILINFH